MSPNLVTIELFSDRLYSMLWDASRSTGLYSVCILKVAMPIRRGTTLIVVGITAILLLALIFVVPALINVDRYRSQVISYLQEKTGKQVEIGRLALTFFPVTIHIDHIGVKNPPIFPAGYVVQVTRIDAELSVGALLHRQVVIKSLVLEDPILNLTSDPDGPWNFENPQSKLSANTFPLGPISSLKIKRGLVIASNLLPSDASGPIFFEAHEISCELEQVNLVGIINPSSSSMDRPWQPEGASSALRCRRGKKSRFQTAVGIEESFLHEYQNGSLWRECCGWPLLRLVGEKRKL